MLAHPLEHAHHALYLQAAQHAVLVYFTLLKSYALADH